MSQDTIPTAAAQPLVSFSINLPADIAKQLVALAAKESENSGERRTPEQIAAIGIASLVECKLEPGEFSQVDHGAQGRAFDANTPGAEAETINVNLLATDFDEFIESVEDLLHNDCGFRDLTGMALADAVDVAYRRGKEAADLCKYNRGNAAQLRRLLAARGTN